VLLIVPLNCIAGGKQMVIRFFSLDHARADTLKEKLKELEKKLGS
jgi:hypothetical protein